MSGADGDLLFVLELGCLGGQRLERIRIPVGADLVRTAMLPRVEAPTPLLRVNVLSANTTFLRLQQKRSRVNLFGC